MNEDIPECFCDSPLCQTSWVCARLGKLRIAYAILEELQEPSDATALFVGLHGGDLSTLEGIKKRIDWECEALCK